MKMLQKITRIVSANINHMIEKAEEPEKMIKQLIREMDESIVELRLEVARAIAAEKRLAHRIGESHQKIESWQANSEKAVRDGDDELARKALSRRLQEEKGLIDLEAQYQKAKALSELMKEDLRKLEDKIQEARRKKEILIARKRSAQAQKSLLETTQKFSTVSRDAQSALDKAHTAAPSLDALEDQVLEMETESEALREVMKATPDLEKVFDESKEKDEVERALEEIKKKVKKEDAE